METGKNRPQMIQGIIAQHRQALTLLESQQEQLNAMAASMSRCLRDSNKVMLMGNGGSAADAQHIAAELVGRYQADRPAFAAIALTTDTSILTSVGNDYGFESIFSRQVQGLAKPGDVVIGISTSGNSSNVIRGIESARAIGCRTLGLLGNAGALGAIVDHRLIIPNTPTARVQEIHILAGHILCELVEKDLSK